MEPNFTDAIRKLSEEYRDLNGDTIEILEEPPSALEFARLVHISRPVIIKGFTMPALKLWSNDYLVKKMGDRPMSIAVTPNGCADAVTPGPDGRFYFVEPATDQMTMNELLNTIEQRNQDSSSQNDIHYLQSQNGNLFSSDSFKESSTGNESVSEFEPLTNDILKEIPWCSDALGQKPDAVNVWIGDERSVTSIHSDPYENIYTVVRGMKHFFLLPPTDSWCLEERCYPHATYMRNSASGQLEICPSDNEDAQVRWSSVIDPEKRSALPKEITPIRVTLRPGETLYLPVGWWHYVRQSGLTIALNWWYDAELRGMSWVLLNFLRNPTSNIPPGNADSQMPVEKRELDK